MAFLGYSKHPGVCRIAEMRFRVSFRPYSWSSSEGSESVEHEDARAEDGGYEHFDFRSARLLPQRSASGFRNQIHDHDHSRSHGFEMYHFYT